MKPKKSKTLYVGSYNSSCGWCNGSASPSDMEHTTPTGYTQTAGCGVKWTHVMSVYLGEAIESAVKDMRPDLIYGVEG